MERTLGSATGGGNHDEVRLADPNARWQRAPPGPVGPNQRPASAMLDARSRRKGKGPGDEPGPDRFRVEGYGATSKVIVARVVVLMPSFEL